MPFVRGNVEMLCRHIALILLSQAARITCQWGFAPPGVAYPSSYGYTSIPQPTYAQQTYFPNQVYTPQQVHVPQQGYAPQQAYMPRQAYAPQQGYAPQQTYMPQQAYAPGVYGGNSGYGGNVVGSSGAGASGAASAASVGYTGTQSTGDGGSQPWEGIDPKPFAFKFNGDFKVKGQPLLLATDEGERSSTQTGLRVWGGGIVLAKYLESKYGSGASGRANSLELGSGTGIVSLALALMGHKVLLSDIPEQAPATRRNMQANSAAISKAGGSADYRDIDWDNLPPRDALGHFDLVLAADVMYHEIMVPWVFETLRWVASGPGCGDILIGHKQRDRETTDLIEGSTPGKYGFKIVETIRNTEQMLGEFGHPSAKIYRLRKV